MNKDFRIPPLSPSYLTPQEVLAQRLAPLIGTAFHLTMFPRTNGFKIRKLVTETLNSYSLPPSCPQGLYTVIPPKAKGVPRMLLEYIDTYIVTTGKQYNLQVWNCNPTSNAALIDYASGEKLTANDVRYIFVRIDPDKHLIRSILICSPTYIESKFGLFGKETVKQQLIITAKQRELITQKIPPVLFYQDTVLLEPLVSHEFKKPQRLFRDRPVKDELLSLEVLWNRLFRLIGMKLDTSDTKTRGQALERLVVQLLGYSIVKDELLLGGYLDILNQLLEVKLQESSTVDLGRYSPQVKETVPSFPQATTEDVRYLIALVDKNTGIITGLVLCPGNRLGDHFSYIATGNYKCQRSIPMTFFDRFDGRVACTQ